MKELIQPIAKRRLSDDVVDQFKTMIAKNHLRPGERLPSERELSALFQVGRPSIREAIRTLDILGYVEIRPGKGIFVKEPNAEFYIKTIQESLQMQGGLEKTTILEILEVRSILEFKTASVAARNANREDLAQLEEAYARVVESVRNQNANQLIEADYEFHKSVAHCSRNKVLCFMIHLIGDLIKRTTYKFLAGPNLPYFYESVRLDHASILEAIRKRSEAEAGEAMARHLRRAVVEMKKFFDGDQESGPGSNPETGR
jgi:GntR family transcriptional regulator, transcriptional repressor for pyruvate dehydrogenase complex